LIKRTADNTTPARTEIALSDVIKYFEELQAALSGIPPQNLINYNETNVTDDPGAKQVVCQCGVKRRE